MGGGKTCMGNLCTFHSILCERETDLKNKVEQKRESHRTILNHTHHRYIYTKTSTVSCILITTESLIKFKRKEELHIHRG